MRWTALFIAPLLLNLPSTGLAQTAIGDRTQRRTLWMFCEVDAADRHDLPYYYSPIVERGDIRDQFVQALWPHWQNGGETTRPDGLTYTIYHAPECLDYFRSRAEAEAVRNERRSRHSSSIEIGAEAVVQAENARAEQAQRVETARLVAEETQRLGAHRAAEAQRLVNMRQAAERARRRSCPLGPNAPVTCM